MIFFDWERASRPFDSVHTVQGWVLDFYRGFNVSWTEPAKYFDAHSGIDKEQLKKCVDTRLMVSQAWKDSPGV